MNLASGETLDYVQIRLGFPRNIQSSQVGTDYETILAEGNNLRMDLYGARRNSRGECEIVPFALNKDGSISASAMGNELFIRASKFPAKAYLAALAAVDERQMAMNLATPHFEGDYEYTNLGMLVHKKLEYKYLGISDDK